MKLKLFKRGKELKKPLSRVELIKELGYDCTHGYSILKSSNTFNLSENYLEYAKNVDSFGYLPQNLGEELDKLFEDDNYIIGIHRTGYTEITNESLNDIFTKGLINNGHLSSGCVAGTHSIESTVSLFYDFTFMVGQLKSASKYKFSNGCIIVKIPKSGLEKNNDIPTPIYCYDNPGNVRLLPEFIYGYIPVSSDNVLNIIHNRNYRDDHSSIVSNSNVFYDDAILLKYKREHNIDLNTINKVSIKEQYSIIEKAYLDTYLKDNEHQASEALKALINNNEVKFFTGSNNRDSLLKFVIYGDYSKILMFGLGMENNNLECLLESFIAKIRLELSFDNSKNK